MSFLLISYRVFFLFFFFFTGGPHQRGSLTSCSSKVVGVLAFITAAALEQQTTFLLSLPFSLLPVRFGSFSRTRRLLLLLLLLHLLRLSLCNFNSRFFIVRRRRRRLRRVVNSQWWPPVGEIGMIRLIQIIF